MQSPAGLGLTMQETFAVHTSHWEAKDNGSTLVQEKRNMALASATEAEFMLGNDAENCS